MGLTETIIIILIIFLLISVMNLHHIKLLAIMIAAFIVSLFFGDNQ